MNLPIYMDHHATTPLDPRVMGAIEPYYTNEFGNAASRQHRFGWRAARAVEDARKKIACLINAATPEEIVFTSGATESNNLALKGICEMYREKGRHIITMALEHRSVMGTSRYLETQGVRVTILPVNREGRVDLDDLRQAITDQTILISIMHANNEIGVLEPVKEIGRIAKEHGVFFHSDITQTAGKIPVDVQAMGIDLASFSAHKMYGPKGIGALYVRARNPRVRLAPLIHGGGHERGFRSGTLNVPGVVGFGAAAEIAQREMVEEEIALDSTPLSAPLLEKQYRIMARS